MKKSFLLFFFCFILTNQQVAQAAQQLFTNHKDLQVDLDVDCTDSATNIHATQAQAADQEFELDLSSLGATAMSNIQSSIAAGTAYVRYQPIIFIYSTSTATTAMNHFIVTVTREDNSTTPPTEYLIDYSEYSSSGLVDITLDSSLSLSTNDSLFVNVKSVVTGGCNGLSSGLINSYAYVASGTTSVKLRY